MTTMITKKTLLAGGSLALALTVAAPSVHAQDASRSLENGGVHIQGWMGQVDEREAGNGMSVDDARLTMDGSTMFVETGPALNYWNPSNTASGDFTVSATFHEPEYMNLNNHPHPYGVFIGGNDLGTGQKSLLYCAAYGNGSFIVRGFGPEPFQMNGRRAAPHDAVNKAADVGQPVTQEIALSVRGDTVSCSINGTEVASYPKSEVVGAGKLKSTDGIYGVRFAHNTEATVTGLSVSR